VLRPARCDDQFDLQMRIGARNPACLTLSVRAALHQPIDLDQGIRGL